MTVFSVNRDVLRRRPKNNILGATTARRDSHGGSCGADLCLMMTHHEALLDGMRGADAMVECGGNDGLWINLAHATVAYRHRRIDSYVIEVDALRWNKSHTFWHRVKRHVPDGLHRPIKGNFNDEWSFLGDRAGGRIYIFLNNSEETMIGTHNLLQSRLDESCGVGSVLLSMDIFFTGESDWEEERFVISGVPRSETTWRLLPARCIRSNATETKDLKIYKYTKRESGEFRKHKRNIEAQRLAFTTYWEQDSRI